MSLSSFSFETVFLLRYGFTICAIPKCGSSMLLALMRRMMHYSDWNQVGTGVNHGPSSGIRYVKRVNANDIRVASFLNLWI